MHCIQGNYKTEDGLFPLIDVMVFAISKEIFLRQERISFKNSNTRIYKALIDTGATCTCISDRVIKELNPQIIGQNTVKGAIGS